MGKIAKDVTTSEFDKFVEKGYAVIDFWAEWCGPCKMMAPEFEEAAAELNGKAKFGKVNIDIEYELAERFQIMSIPSLVFFRDGEAIDVVTGVMQKEEIAAKLEEMIQR